MVSGRPGLLAQAGLTLIELMVTLTVMAFLLLLGVSLGGDWVNGSRTQQARGDLEQGWGVAKALALRNPCQTHEGQAAAVLKLEHLAGASYRLLVEAAQGSATCSYLSSRSVPTWSAQLPAGVQVLVDGAALSEGAQHSWGIDNRGLPVGATGTSLVVQRGGAQNDETIQWY